MYKRVSKKIEILSLLARYGVMDRSSIAELMTQKVTKRWLRQVLGNLASSGLIKKGSLQIGGSPCHYWLLATDDKAIEQVSELTGIPINQFRNKSTHWSQYPHETNCTKVQASIERKLPYVWVLREASGEFRLLPEHLMTEKVREAGYLPDLCLGVPIVDSNSELDKDAYRWIAVEVDRSHRSSNRLAARLNTYTRHTSFSGLLYFVPDEASLKKIESIYTTREAKKALRIKGGSSSFLASAVLSNSLFDVQKMNVKCGAGEMPLLTWLALISLRETHKRDEVMEECLPPGALFNAQEGNT